MTESNCTISTRHGDPTFSVDGQIYRLDCEYTGEKPKRSLKTSQKILFVPGKTRRADFIFGPADSGKSTFASERIIDPYKKKYPNNPFYLVSPKDDDKTVNRRNPVRLDPTFDNFLGDEPLTLEEMDPCIILFDDCESIADNAIRKAVDSFRDICLTRGRSLGISVVTIMHVHMGGHATKILILESSTITYFPKAGQLKGIHDILKIYGGLEEDTIKEMMKLGDGGAHSSVTFYKRFPNWVATEHQFFLL